MKKPTMIVVAVMLLSEIIWQGYKRYCNFHANEKQNKSIEKVLFFTEDSAFCRPHVGSNKACNKPNCAVINFNTLKKYLDSAKRTIDVCMYFFTTQELGNAIIKAQKRGVAIRVIIDATMTQNSDSTVVSFRKACIKVRAKHSKDLMHHKFVMIDNDILLTGSANWTMQAFFGNFENIIITNSPALVKQFGDEFQRLWDIYDKDSSDSDQVTKRT